MTAVRVQTDPRIARRRRAVARSKRRRLLIGLAVCVVVGAAVWAMFWSPVLVVRDVTVRGAEQTDRDDVTDATGLVGAEENLLLLSTSEVKNRVARLPWVDSVKVDRILPGTVRVRISEREPAFILAIGAAKWTLDETGRVLEVGEVRKGLPVLSGVEVGRVEPGVELQTSEARDALSAHAALPSKVKRSVIAIFAPTSERISFALQGGTEIRYGAARRMRAKAVVIKALFARLKAEGRSAAYLDVRVPTSPAVGSQDEAATDDGTASEGISP